MPSVSCLFPKPYLEKAVLEGVDEAVHETLFPFVPCLTPKPYLEKAVLEGVDEAMHGNLLPSVPGGLHEGGGAHAVHL
jgi:hypothetical protein